MSNGVDGTWDLAVVGAGPAGAATAIGALRAEPGLRVVLLDRSDFPRDKSCGDGVAPHVIDLLDDAGVHGIADGWTPVPRLRLTRGDLTADREMARSTWVIPRTVLDHRLVQAAQDAGAHLVRHRVRSVGEITAAVVVGADGARSVVAPRDGRTRSRTALAIRGYVRTPQTRRSEQVIVFSDTRQPSYAWSFDRGDGWANVGYGELLASSRPSPSRALLLDQLERLLPGATDDASGWRAHHLPLAPRRWRPEPGRVLLVGDAAGLVNPLTGEGIYYAVATGLAAGRAAAGAVRTDGGASAGRSYRRAVRPLLARHLRHTAAAARLCLHGSVLDAGIRAAARDQRVFDDLVELGLARGSITATMARGLVGALTAPTRHADRTAHPPGGDKTCEC